MLRKLFRKLLWLYIMKKNTTKKFPNVSNIFHCEKCDYKCFKKSLYDKHLLTKKHNTTNTTKIQQKSFHYCECGKQYTHRASLFNHKKKCKHVGAENTGVIENENEPIVEFLLKENLEIKKDNLEMKKMMIDLCQKIEPISINNTNNTHNINSNNNNIFNIQLFLNEDCKDAMNMTEFIESIQLTLEDMTKINQEGQTEGMSKLLINKLRDIDILKRPVHCSDSVKKILYVKEEDKWELDGKNKSIIKDALDKITIKSIHSLPTIEQDADSYTNIINELLKEPRDDKKIISKLAKEVCVK